MAAGIPTLGLVTFIAGASWLQHRADSSLPRPSAVDVYAAFIDITPVTLTLTMGDAAVTWRTTVDDITSNVLLWRRMRLPDWNTVPDEPRRDGLRRMFERYRPVLLDPDAWDRMRAGDWDLVPQPVRVIAYRQMVAYWSGYYDISGRCGAPPRLAADILAAIVMTESWFEHRAVFVNADGGRDLGLGQASDYARMRVRQLHQRGVVDISFTDDEYFDPWKATRFVALWMTILLDETGGDLDAAVRAYNRGLARAGDEHGDAYLDLVQRRLTRFIRNRDAPPSWDVVWSHGRAMERDAWPWTARGSDRRRPR